MTTLHQTTQQPDRRKIQTSKMPKLTFVLIFIALIISVITAEKVKPPIVYLNKCCPLSQQLDETKNCVVGGTDRWVPAILMISQKRTFTPLGQAPKFFRIQEGARPTNCTADLQLYTGQFLVLSDGLLYIQEINKHFEGQHFCVDKDVALVCNPPPLPNNVSMAGILGSGIKAAAATLPATSKLRKCCGPNAVYDKSLKNCFSLNEGSVHSRRLVTNSSSIEVIYGFPRCKADAQYTMVGSYFDDNFDAASGVFRLASGRIFSSAEFCVEHTVEDDVYADVHAFTCADQFIQMDPISVEATDQKVSHPFTIIY